MSYHNNMVIGIMVCLIGMGCLFNSCMQEELQAVANKANIQIELDNATDFQPTKAVDESTYQDLSKYSLEIWQNETLKNSFSYVNKPSSLELANGTYTLKAFYGTKSKYSRTGFYVEGSTIFNVEGKDQTVTCRCEPTMGKLKVKFDASMSTYFTDYEVVYTTSSITGEAVKWAKNDVDPWYIEVARNGETVTATIKLTPRTDYVSNGTSTSVVRTYTLQPNKLWTLEIAPSYSSSKGQLGISIKLDTSTNNRPIDIVVPSEWS